MPASPPRRSRPHQSLFAYFTDHHLRRVMLAGVWIPRGEAVVALIASANRDASEFDEPYRFDVARSNPSVHRRMAWQ